MPPEGGCGAPPPAMGSTAAALLESAAGAPGGAASAARTRRASPQLLPSSRSTAALTPSSSAAALSRRPSATAAASSAARTRSSTAVRSHLCWRLFTAMMKAPPRIQSDRPYVLFRASLWKRVISNSCLRATACASAHASHFTASMRLLNAWIFAMVSGSNPPAMAP
eukprot:CAMPEP_0183808554 /NCGR_PEP_ID=MMETSP0803_2-20130417/43851_1 /TAXON_ID=195967 /ORGANISM="Crustomastix stigmata, Strain CCMP3273" /LENGTH=166 /DNA_ID=CAMNT_0026053351 /DNA_START=92 /DNA_END=589 /DNA_ORIENTATION=+